MNNAAEEQQLAPESPDEPEVVDSPRGITHIAEWTRLSAATMLVQFQEFIIKMVLLIQYLRRNMGRIVQEGREELRDELRELKMAGVQIGNGIVTTIDGAVDEAQEELGDLGGELIIRSNTLPSTARTRGDMTVAFLRGMLHVFGPVGAMIDNYLHRKEGRTVHAILSSLTEVLNDLSDGRQIDDERLRLLEAELQGLQMTVIRLQQDVRTPPKEQKPAPTVLSLQDIMLMQRGVDTRLDQYKRNDGFAHRFGASIVLTTEKRYVLPENVEYGSDLTVSTSGIVKMPDRMFVTGVLRADNCYELESLGTLLTAAQGLYVRGNPKLTCIPAMKHPMYFDLINIDCSDCPQLKTLGNGIKAKELWLIGTQVTELPEDILVREVIALPEQNELFEHCRERGIEVRTMDREAYDKYRLLSINSMRIPS